MAFYRGRDGVVKVGASPTDVGEVQSWTLDTEQAVGEAWGMGDDAMRHFASAPTKGSGSVECYYDPADAGQGGLAVGATVALELYPGGETVGFEYLSFSAIITTVGWSGSKGDLVMAAFNFVVNGDITPAVVA